MGRTPCCQKVGLKKGRWTAEEDDILAKYIQANGEGSWRSLPKNAGLLRCGKSCRLRWINYLRADLKRGNITEEEEETIIKLHASVGSRWSFIASNLPGRTDNEIKNYWNSHLRRKIHTFLRPSSEKIEPAVLDVAGETTKKNADKTVRKAAVKKKKKESRSTQIQGDGDNITDVNMNGPVADSNIIHNVSTDRNEQNVNAVSAVDDEDVVPLPATPTFEKETYNLASTESMEDCLDMGMEQVETGVLCSEVKETDVLGPFEGIDGEMLSFADIIDNDPNGVWSGTNLMDGVTENNVLANNDDLSNSGTANGERAELRSCPSVNSFFDERKLDLDLDFDWDWDWKSIVQGPDQYHDQQQKQQLEENDQNVLSWAWEMSCESEDEKEKEKHNAMVAWLLS